MPELDQAAAPEPTRREELSAALDSAIASQPEKSEPPTAKVEVSGAAQADVPQGTSRPKDEKGRFIPKSEAKPAEPTPEAAAAKAARKYPSTWKKDYEPVYRKLETNSEFQPILDEIERREGEYFKGLEPYKESAAYGQNFRKVIQPYEQGLQKLGLSPDQAVRNLLAADHAIRSAAPESRAALMVQLMRGYGIDPESVKDVQPIDPTIAMLQNRLAQVEQGTKTFLSSFQQQNDSRAQQEVEAFKKDKPYFEDVRPKMYELATRGVSSDLLELYNLAVAANPVIQDKIFAEKQAKAESERKQKEQQKVAAAKSASGQVKGAPTGSAQSRNLKANSRRAMLDEALARVS